MRTVVLQPSVVSQQQPKKKKVKSVCISSGCTSQAHGRPAVTLSVRASMCVRVCASCGQRGPQTRAGLPDLMRRAGQALSHTHRV